MKIRAITNYTDKQLNQAIKVGREYEVSDERAEQIINAGYAVAVIESVEPIESIKPIEEVVIDKPKKPSRKKKA